MSQLLTASSIMMCPHGGTVQAVTTNARTQIAGDFALRSSDMFTIAGCPFNIAGAPHPCVMVQWVQPAARSQVISDFTLTMQSVGLCVAPDQTVQGMVLITFAQPRVTGL